MNKMIYAISRQASMKLSGGPLIMVGGKASTGIRLEGLKANDDYAVITVNVTPAVVHPLKSKTSGVVLLEPYKPLVIEDLTLLLVDEPMPSRHFTEPNADSEFESRLLSLVNHFATQQDYQAALKSLLEAFLVTVGMEKGLVVTQTASHKYELVVQKGLSASDPWLSETLLKETLKAKSPQVIQNIKGSDFDSSKSLVATKFNAVIAHPLNIRGETIGALLAGSPRPHMGLNETQRDRADLLSKIGSLFLHFHLREARMRAEIADLRQARNATSGPFVTNHVPLQKTCLMAEQVAPTDLSVLIQGQTGVGKELLARWIHDRSDRKRQPFIPINCGAIPLELLEGLLFGYRKGAFTGAHSDQIGKFQAAHGGTIFLDEIGDLPGPLQVKLLRVLQEKSVEPLGALIPTKIDVRVIAASHKSLANMIERQQFREDLYYRLAEVTLEIPSLQERPEDIGLIAGLLLKQIAPEKRISDGGLRWLQVQPWKGNVRELQSAIRRAAILSARSEIEQSDFLKGLPSSQVSQGETTEFSWLGGKDLDDARNRFVLSKITEALRRVGGKRREAAELLGITPRTLFRYLEDMKDKDDISVILD